MPYARELQSICRDTPSCNSRVLNATVELAIEIAREGREGRRVGTLFTLGCHEAVLPLARPLILDPIARHPARLRSVFDLNLQGTIKELAQLDGAFVISWDGVFLAACRYLITTGRGIDVGLGVGSRHLVGASISRETGALAIVVSESAVVRIFESGRLRAELLPEVWMLHQHDNGRGEAEDRGRANGAVGEPLSSLRD